MSLLLSRPIDYGAYNMDVFLVENIPEFEPSLDFLISLGLAAVPTPVLSPPQTGNNQAVPFSIGSDLALISVVPQVASPTLAPIPRPLPVHVHVEPPPPSPSLPPPTHPARRLLKRGRKPVNKVCSICQKTFTRSTNMRRHIEEHGQSAVADRPFGCDRCSDRFFRKHDMEVHFVRVHTSLRLYSCNDCTYRAKTKHDLRAHQTRHYSGYD